MIQYKEEDLIGYIPYEESKEVIGTKVKIVGRYSIIPRTKSNHSDKPFLILKLEKGEKVFTSFVWEGKDGYDFLKNVKKQGSCTFYGELQKIEKEPILYFKNIQIEEDEAVKTTNPKVLKSKLIASIEQIKKPILQKLIRGILNNPDVKDKILKSPASEKTAYNYTGGLAEMIIDSVSLADTIVDNILLRNQITLDKDLLLTGLFLSYVGRVQTLQMSTLGEVEKTIQGSLAFDTVYSFQYVTQELQKMYISETDEDKAYLKSIEDDLIHMILTSKELYEKGSVAARSKYAKILVSISNIIYTEGLFSNLEKEYLKNPEEKLLRPYSGSKVYYINE